jgi:hypothetical protein
VKRLRHTLRRDRERHQVDVAEGAIEPPEDLPLEGALVWGELAPTLTAAGMLKPVDAAVFAQFAVMTAHLRQLWVLNQAAPASYISQWRALATLFGCAGEASRVLGRKRPEPAANPFANNGIKSRAARS